MAQSWKSQGSKGAHILPQNVGQLLLAQQVLLCTEGFLDQGLPLHSHGQPDCVWVLLELHEDVVCSFQDCCVVGLREVAAAIDEVDTSTAVVLLVNVLEQPFQMIHFQEKIYCLGLCIDRAQILLPEGFLTKRRENSRL